MAAVGRRPRDGERLDLWRVRQPALTLPGRLLHQGYLDSPVEIYRRGFEGYNHPVIYQGEITGKYTDYSDTLAIFALKG
jgi:hypothetical protein